MHLLVDGTGLRLCGPCGWLAEKHGARRRRSWRKLHLATDADTGHIVASALTDRASDDAAEVGPLLVQVDGPVTSLTADGAFDRDDVYAETTPTRRDRHLRFIAERGRMGQQKATGCGAPAFRNPLISFWRIDLRRRSALKPRADSHAWRE